jgi:cardiolipin synthase
MTVFNVPNTLTILRILLIPVFITALDYRKYDYALYIFVAASLSDMVDGLWARLKHQRTELGQVLDPLADKFMLITSFVFFTYYGWVPAWVTIIIISRDVIIVTGTVALYFVTGSLKVDPSRSGKTAIALQFVLLSYVLLNINYGIVPEAAFPLILLTASLSVFSGVQYIYRGLKLAG